ncbi:MAG: GlsB/YeaQ/YmgE family stress response membrane protein [Rudaea sp.]|nr:GlsB/YeaQ/YmgE family stress response membrane protein [Rudaea sp.]
MTAESLIVFLLIGAVAGWLAGVVVRGGGFGLVGDIIIGILGAFVAGLLLPRLGLGLTGIAGEIIYAAIGAIILLVVIRLIKRV